MVVEDLHDLIRLIEQHPDWRAELRRVLLGDELLQLPGLVREILQVLQRHSEILARHSEAIERLAEAQRRTEQRVEELAEAQKQMAQQINRLLEWQRGEAGRREGEHYEAQTVRRAMSVFLGGWGGSPAEPHMRARLGRWLARLYEEQEDLDPSTDPALADIIWWKGDEVFVVEVSLKVDAEDIRRAKQRAATLRKVGIGASPAVIGEDWAAGDVQALAMQEGVEWMVGRGLSPGFLRFRRLRPQ